MRIMLGIHRGPGRMSSREVLRNDSLWLGNGDLSERHALLWRVEIGIWSRHLGIERSLRQEILV
jgi:hypothetical protein